ncbi:uncharacterized protein F4822DRAFT_396141 [Hypoxylon trugodes]|uniref:uncharacterized protein n=1 Tax=Hypoxylon trugodes TaxID=326681 RepID=UPI00219C4F6B|nr:uncharacterized protein F4822DRAFT_396141 [Hypoxylon trugodes]KAI1391255.1 hypothetical protein F4822DRAFT_396141 [Hypoxylon trugodes]
MKLITILVILASSSCLGVVATSTRITTTSSESGAVIPPTLEKRDAYTCYGSTNTSVSDCQKILDTIRGDPRQSFKLFSNICAVWNEGSCRVRFCAQPYVTRPVSRSAEWLATYIASPLLDGCISKGSMGVIADNPNINSHAGTYRVWVY